MLYELLTEVRKVMIAADSGLRDADDNAIEVDFGSGNWDEKLMAVLSAEYIGAEIQTQTFGGSVTAGGNRVTLTVVLFTVDFAEAYEHETTLRALLHEQRITSDDIDVIESTMISANVTEEDTGARLTCIFEQIVNET